MSKLNNHENYIFYWQHFVGSILQNPLKQHLLYKEVVL